MGWSGAWGLACLSHPQGAAAAPAGHVSSRFHEEYNYSSIVCLTHRVGEGRLQDTMCSRSNTQHSHVCRSVQF
jgi:hypothetical protein